MKDYADLHTHTIASGHAYGTITEMVHAAALKNLPILGITEHAPSMPGSCGEMQFCNFNVIPPVLEGVRLLFGCELNIVDYSGTIDLSERMLKRLSYTVVSLHDLCLKPGTAWCQGGVVELDHAVVVLCGFYDRLIVQWKFSIIRMSEDRDIRIF